MFSKAVIMGYFNQRELIATHSHECTRTSFPLNLGPCFEAEPLDDEVLLLPLILLPSFRYKVS